ncbi:hypothetical protein PFLmoz3_05871 [Pseudomonas fluorescens]|uniref:Uncharacterized protein n=1 Tax=Pseudomonas fluorescens TaxID=294 RepID=A0A109LB79_PSEFL|nr:hypothetical protein PFLmoz3_05871 [Pseudomonas fluorescens]
MVRDQGRAVFPCIVPVPAVAQPRRSRHVDRPLGRERIARGPHVHRARPRRREGARVLRARKRHHLEPVRAGPPPRRRWLPGTTVAHQPHERRGAVSPARDPHRALWRSRSPSGRTPVGHAQSLHARVGALRQGSPTGSGLRRIFPGSAVAIRRPGRRVLRAACTGRADRPDGRDAGCRLRRARPGHDRIREPAARLGQRPNAAIDAACVAGAGNHRAPTCQHCATHRRGCIRSAACRPTCGNAFDARERHGCQPGKSGQPCGGWRSASGAHRLAGTDDRTAPVHSAHGRRPVG